MSNDSLKKKKIESVTEREGSVCVCVCVCVYLLFWGLHKLTFSLLIDRREK